MFATPLYQLGPFVYLRPPQVSGITELRARRHGAGPNPVLRGWSNFYRHSWGAKRVFGTLDFYIWWTIHRWLKKKHDGIPARAMISRYGRRPRGRRTIRWGDGDVVTFVLSRTPVRPFSTSWLKAPNFVTSFLESPVHIETVHAGFGEGRPETDPVRTGNRAGRPLYK